MSKTNLTKYFNLFNKAAFNNNLWPIRAMYKKLSLNDAAEFVSWNTNGKPYLYPIQASLENHAIIMRFKNAPPLQASKVKRQLSRVANSLFPKMPYINISLRFKDHGFILSCLIHEMVHYDLFRRGKRQNNNHSILFRRKLKKVIALLNKKYPRLNLQYATKGGQIK